MTTNLREMGQVLAICIVSCIGITFLEFQALPAQFKAQIETQITIYSVLDFILWSCAMIGMIVLLLVMHDQTEDNPRCNIITFTLLYMWARIGWIAWIVMFDTI